ncbi:MAG: hypothetical protein ABI640_17950 [Gammaproteobacteria bacterium]
MSTEQAQRLNRSCYCVGADIPSLRTWLEQDLNSRGLSQPIVATHPHLFSALPVFVAQEHATQIRNVIRAIEKVIALPAYRRAVLAEAPSVAQLAPAARGVLTSYDFHITQAGPKLIEINTNAGGVMLNAALSRAQRACCVEVEEFSREPHSAGKLETALYEMFIQEWRLARGDAPLSSVAIVDDAPEEQYLYPEFLLFQRLFESRGIAAVIAAPHELRFESGALWHGERRVDIVYNRLTDFYFADPTHSALLQAYTAEAAVVTPHPHAHALYANKRNLAVLTDREALRTIGATDETAALLLQSIPRTVTLVAGSEDRWWNDRKHWFFKPALGYGSRGSYRGDKLTRKTFAEIMKADYIAQAVVPPSERWLSNEPGQRPLKLDLRNYVYAGETLLIAARLYQGQTTNFRTPGGGFAPVYLTPASLGSYGD